MNEQSDKQIGASKSAQPATPWTRPEILRFDAGAAELGDITNAEGNGQFS